MVIKSILNHNAAVVFYKKKEHVVLGKGIAFGKKKGDMIDNRHVEKIYSVRNHENNENFNYLFSNYDYTEIVEVSNILEYVFKKHALTFDAISYFSLLDHLLFSIKRAKEEIYIPVSEFILYDIKIFFPKEYHYSKQILLKINDKFGLSFERQEITYTTLHFVNAKWKNNLFSSNDFDVIMRHILKLLEDHYNKEIDIKSLSFHRFITHLNYLFIREFDVAENSNMFMNVQNNIYSDMYFLFKDFHSGVELISEYFSIYLKIKLTIEEKVYLAIHLQRLLEM